MLVVASNSERGEESRSQRALADSFARAPVHAAGCRLAAIVVRRVFGIGTLALGLRTPLLAGSRHRRHLDCVWSWTSSERGHSVGPRFPRPSHVSKFDMITPKRAPRHRTRGGQSPDHPTARPRSTLCPFRHPTDSTDSTDMRPLSLAKRRYSRPPSRALRRHPTHAPRATSSRSARRTLVQRDRSACART